MSYVQVAVSTKGLTMLSHNALTHWAYLYVIGFVYLKPYIAQEDAVLPMMCL